MKITNLRAGRERRDFVQKRSACRPCGAPSSTWCVRGSVDYSEVPSTTVHSLPVGSSDPCLSTSHLPPPTCHLSPVNPSTRQPVNLSTCQSHLPSCISLIPTVLSANPIPGHLFRLAGFEATASLLSHQCTPGPAMEKSHEHTSLLLNPPCRVSRCHWTCGIFFETCKAQSLPPG